MLLGLVAMAAAQTAGVPVSKGVEVTDVPSVGIVTSFADCISREVGSLPEQDRAGVIGAAAKTCRANLDADYAANRFTMNGARFPKRWWTANGKLFDAFAADAIAFARTLPAGAKLKTKWRYPDGSLIGPGNAPYVPSRWVVFVGGDS